MYPVPGGTQMDVGLMWGLRALSDRSEWTNFFGYDAANAPLAFDNDSTRKIMILLTDGENQAPYHFEGYYGCLDESWRSGAGPCWRQDDVKSIDKSALDNLTLDACEAIREDYGVELFTIAVGVNSASTISMLETCAGHSENAFSVQSGQLANVFEALASRAIRIKN